MSTYLDSEIRLRLGSNLENNIENNYRVWLNCYHGEPFWLDNKSDKESLNLCASISSELARLTTIELETEVDDKALDEIYQKIIDKIRNITEYGLALGGVILKPYLADDNIGIDICTPDMYVILGFTSFGDINRIAFLDRIKTLEKERIIFLTRIEEHTITGNQYTIQNTAYKSNSSNELGQQIPLTAIPQWQNIKEIDFLKRDKPLFTYFKNPQANNLDLRSFEGISCFARALSLIQDADEQYQRIIWEYKGSELAIDADVSVLKNNAELPQGKERLFRDLGKTLDDNFYKVFSPQIRDISLFNGLNNILRKIEFICGLAYGTLSDVNDTEKTAEEIKASKQRSFSTVKDIQNELESTLTEFVEVLTFWFDVLKIKYNKDYTMQFNFDDSLIVDSKTERQIKLQEVATGIITKEKYLQDVYGIEETENIIPKEQVIDDVIEEE